MTPVTAQRLRGNEYGGSPIFGGEKETVSKVNCGFDSPKNHQNTGQGAA